MILTDKMLFPPAALAEERKQAGGGREEEEPIHPAQSHLDCPNAPKTKINPFGKQVRLV